MHRRGRLPPVTADAPAVASVQGVELRYGIRPFLADEHPRAGWVVSQGAGGWQAGQLGDVCAVAVLAVAVDSVGPGAGGQLARAVRFLGLAG